MKKSILFFAFLPLTACATMFNGTEQDIKIHFYDSQTGAKIPNDKVKVTTAEKDLTINEDQTYTIKRKQIEDLHYLSSGYHSKTDKVHARASALHYLNLLWEIPLIFAGTFGGAALGSPNARTLGAELGGLGGLAIGLGLSLGIDVGLGGIYVYSDEIKVYLDPRSK